MQGTMTSTQRGGGVDEYAKSSHSEAASLIELRTVTIVTLFVNKNWLMSVSIHRLSATVFQN